MQHLKYFLDRLGAAISLALLCPILLLLTGWTYRKMGAPIFFAQTRLGLNGRPFRLYKFRTMTDARDGCGQLLADKKRLTSFGTFLRASSLDELPELWNILKGDMSFVGPRPLLEKYFNRYTAEQKRRHEMLPGLTGWAQIHGRNAISWEEKFRYDIWYVDHWSLWLDLKIFLITLWKVVKREGINQKGQDATAEFLGANPHRREPRA